MRRITLCCLTLPKPCSSFANTNAPTHQISFWRTPEAPPVTPLGRPTQPSLRCRWRMARLRLRLRRRRHRRRRHCHRRHLYCRHLHPQQPERDPRWILHLQLLRYGRPSLACEQPTGRCTPSRAAKVWVRGAVKIPACRPRTPPRKARCGGPSSVRACSRPTPSCRKQAR